MSRGLLSGAPGRVLLRFMVSVLLLVGLAWLLDMDVLVRRLTDLSFRWILVGLAISFPQMALLALRWRITAARLGLELTFATALREYYLATFLNQLLPGGVTGDVSRAWRHGRGTRRERAAERRGFGNAVRAVVLERASGQVVMAVVAAVALVSLPVAPAARGLTLVFAVATIVLPVIAVVALRRARTTPSLWHDLHAALLARDVIGVQLATSALTLATYIAMYVVAARAVGLTTPLGTLLPLIPPVLLSMLVPVTIAGWGVREAVAAGIWSIVGLTAEDGVAASAAYGLLVFISTLPGVLVPFSPSLGRRGGPLRDGNGDSEGVARHPAS